MAPSTALAAVKDVALPSESAEADGKEGWCDLCVSPAELRPEFSLTMGQCFNWKRRGAAVKDDSEDQEWVGVLGRAVLAVRQTPTSTLFRILATADKNECAESMATRLRDYFQLEVPLGPLYERWGQADCRMKEVAKHIPGVRVIRQDPVECLFSFICSSNNNIARITLMLDRLRIAYGQPLGLDGYCAFPSVERLSRASEAELRKLGFGYRAKFIVETAKKLQELGGADWLLSLRERLRKEVQEALLVFPGVGRKVADCVALFSLDQQGAIPVDVHVWRIACRDYDSTLKASKSLTPTIYDRVGDMFRHRFGDCAGWAHSLLFAAELPNYRVRLPPELQADMEAFKREEKEEKAVKRDEAKKRKLQQEEETVVVQPGSGDNDTDSIGSISMSEVEDDDGPPRPIVSTLHAHTTLVNAAAAAATATSTHTITSSSSISRYATCTASEQQASSIDVPVTPDVANIRRKGGGNKRKKA